MTSQLKTGLAKNNFKVKWSLVKDANLRDLEMRTCFAGFLAANGSTRGPVLALCYTVQSGNGQHLDAITVSQQA